MFAYGAGPCARGRPGHRPGQHLHGRRQAAAQGRRSASTPRPGRPRSRSSPTTPPTRRTSPPTWSARPSTTRSPPACWSPTRVRLADDVEAELDKQVFATQHTERIRTALAGQQSAIVLVDDVEQGLDVVNAYAAEHLEIHTADAGCRRRPGPQRRRDLRRSVRAGLARRLLRRLQPRAADGRLRLPLLGAVGAVVPQGRPRRRLLPRRAGRGGRPRRHAGRGRGPAGPRRRRAGPVRPGVTPACPLCGTSCGARALRRPAARRPGPAQRQREPLPALGRRGGRHRGAPSPRRRATLNRYPDREFTALREALAAYLGARRHPRAGLGRQRLQRGDAPPAPGLRRTGPAGAELRPDLLDVSRVRPRHPHRLGGRPPRGGLHPRRRPRGRAGPRAATPRRTAAVAEQPHRHRAARSRRSPRCARRWTTGWWWSTRRTPSSAAPARRSALELLPSHPNLVVTRTMSKAFALAGARLGYLAAARRSATRCASSGCPTTSRRSPRRSRCAALRHADELLGRGRRPARRARRDASSGCATQGFDGRRQRRQLRAVRALRRPARRLAGAARPRRADPRDRARRLAAGLHRHRRRRWQRSGTPSTLG